MSQKNLEQHKKNTSRIKKLAISLGVSGAIVAGFAAPAFALSPMTYNASPNACFGQVRAYNSVNSAPGTTGYYMSLRKGANPTDNSVWIAEHCPLQ